MLPLRTLGPLMVMILLCDADDACPATLEPPVVVGEHGKTVNINCTWVDRDYDGMYWRINGKDAEIEDDRRYIMENLKLSDWNISAECRIKLDENSECSKKLEIIVYKNPQVSIFPTKYTSNFVEGTAYELQCDILEAAPVQNLSVRWFKGNETIKVETFSNKTKKPVEVSPIITHVFRREDDGAQFGCEAQLDFGQYGVLPPVVAQMKPLSVHYAPEFKNKTEDDEVYNVTEGFDVTLSCEAEGNPPPVFSWTSNGVKMSETTDHLNLSGVFDSAIYSCTASNAVGNLTKQLEVEVQKVLRMAAPETTETPQTSAISSTEALSPNTPKTTAGGCPLVLTPGEILVRFGDPASVNCSTLASDAAVMGWEVTIGGKVEQDPPVGRPLTWEVNKLEDWDIEAKCFLTTAVNWQCYVMPVITLYKTPDSVVVSEVNPGPMLEGREFTLTCDITGVAPLNNLTVYWYKDDEIVYTQTFNNSTRTPVNQSSILRVTPKRDDNGTAFKCEAKLQFRLGRPFPEPTLTSSPYIANVLYAPVMKEERFDKEVALGENVTFHCSAEGNPPPQILWSFPPAANVKQTTEGRQSSITITGATSTNAGVYICNATNGLGIVTRSFTVIMSSEDKSDLFWLWFLIPCLVVILVAIIIYSFQSHIRKNGQYSFVPNNANGDIPLAARPEA